MINLQKIKDTLFIKMFDTELFIITKTEMIAYYANESPYGDGSIISNYDKGQKLVYSFREIYATENELILLDEIKKLSNKYFNIDIEESYLQTSDVKNISITIGNK